MSRHFFSIVVITALLLTVSATEGEKPVHFIDFPELPEIRWNIPETITFTVVDEADKPLAGIPASFSMVIRLNENPGAMPPDERDTFQLPDLVTDANGKIVIEIPAEKREKPPLYMTFLVMAQGLLMREYINLGSGNADDSGLVTVPAETKITMKEGKMFRLKVVDEEGNPITGAQVGSGVSFPFHDRGWPRDMEITDENGVATRGPVPKDFNERRLLYDRKIYHPDFVRWPLNWGRLGANSPFSEKVIDESTITLKRGRAIGGVIRDADGQPVVGADLFVCGQDVDADKEAQTDENGKFEIKGVLDMPLVLVVRKPGMVRFVKKIMPDQFDEPLSITMQTAKTLRVQLVTDEGTPYTHQFGLVPPPIDMEEHQYSYNLTYGFQQSDGRWEWDEAPDEEVDYRLQIVGYSSPRPGERQILFPSYDEIFSFRPREEPYQITLKTREYEPRDDQSDVFRDGWRVPEKLEVCVLDEDGNPKPGATVTVACQTDTGGFGFGGQRSPKLSLDFTTNADGTVHFHFSEAVRQSTTQFDIWVSADHCLTMHHSWQSDSRRGRRSGSPIGERLEILIASDQKTTGFVRDEEGNPVEGAEVTLHGIQNCVYLGEQHQLLKRTATLVTDANGKWECELVLPKGFSMNPWSYIDRSNYVEIKKDGFLDSKTAVSANARFVTLKRTKKITGRVIDENGNPLKGVQVALDNQQTVPRYEVYTGQDGCFEISAVPGESPKTGILAHLPLGRRQMAWQLLDLSSDVKDVELVLKPGATLRIRFEMDEGAPSQTCFFISPSTANLGSDRRLKIGSRTKTVSSSWKACPPRRRSLTSSYWSLPGTTHRDTAPKRATIL